MNMLGKVLYCGKYRAYIRGRSEFLPLIYIGRYNQTKLNMNNVYNNTTFNIYHPILLSMIYRSDVKQKVYSYIKE